ncbi:hypothetical protein AO715_14460 [Xanthomonas sp. Mitacek01]|nr:hypothetical protein AO715_14460 [Xanthomonas sp. Mitacek01]
MQRLIDAVRNGHRYVVQGEVPLTKGADVLAKLQGRFPVLSRDRHFAHRERAKGRPVYKLVALCRKEAQQLNFWLLSNVAVEGVGERWVDAHEDRLRVFQYEAVRQTRSAPEGTGQLTWTWQIERGHMGKLRMEMLDHIASKNDKLLGAFIQSSKLWPGFHGVREQRSALVELCNGRWRRVRSSSEPPPDWPRLRYLQRIATR